MWAGLLHDCRRKNDNADPRHGLRAGEWLKGRKVLPRGVNHFESAIRFAISVHADPYDKIVALPRYEGFRELTDILKTADALDRFRFPRSDWWFDPRFIRLPANPAVLGFAFDLALLSERAFLEGAGNPGAVLAAWRELSS